MASKTSQAESEGPVIDMAEMGARIAKRRAELGYKDAAHPELVEGRNAGKNRTPSKRALLKAIEDLGGKW
jgi:hypothetical protein